ncbi:M1 family metallopeptidase [Reichenbachiella agarivorans]|uniref:Aminopeptidase N n=1 Tax=Reichenbachiella agarivorans TaxID=2979464 RepID=A0ABY6CSJ6_9BACT|nr:M1 family metallopeptidase [Reichenbachiella agarivorans]UXP32834.1 M1 family metallopeptidase [Reichenbachiella agarivorans]
MKTKNNIPSQLIALILAMTLFSQCNSHKANEPMNTVIKDNHSYANPSESIVTHLDWTAELDFEKHIIAATAKLTLDNTPQVKHVILDTKGLNIVEIKNQDGETLNYELKPEDPILGSALLIEIDPETTEVSITYQTTPEAEALQWLTPEQTQGKVKPFLFSQSQAILARSWIPIQDSPGIRFTYTAEVTVPRDLLPLMSASNPVEKNTTGTYHFEMKQPIPAYLMALTVGDIDFLPLGQRSGVYAEPSMLEKSADEFEGLENMIAAAEELYGAYRWDRYDIIVLPPSFPFGGMENPRLTFATPTIIAGDKSLISLVAHELAHSWSGNLVTNATWDDFWLNEGFTVYFENRIMESLYGREYSEMLAMLSLQDLKAEIIEISATNPADTHLKLNLDGRNPDDGLTAIAYDKGYFFLRLIEETVGREKWDAFVKNYFNTNAFKVMTTEEFVEILQRDLIDENTVGLDSTFYQQWIYGPELPANCPQPVSNKFDNVEKALSNWQENHDTVTLDSSYGSSQWSTHEWLHFIRLLPENYGIEEMTLLDDAFDFTNSGNSEIFALWAVQIISNQYEAGYPNLEKFLVHTGRRKFLTPLYKELIKTEEGTEMARAIYQKARPNYHSVAYNSIDALLK